MDEGGKQVRRLMVPPEESPWYADRGSYVMHKVELAEGLMEKVSLGRAAGAAMTSMGSRVSRVGRIMLSMSVRSLRES